MLRNNQQRLRVLISAYACEPGRGSESEVGWRVAQEMAKYCDVVVVTRANNKARIEAESPRQENSSISFHYYDLPSILLSWKKRGLGIPVYYVLWQCAIRWRFRALLKSVDLVHHVTFNSAQFPGCWGATSPPVILGPLGGGMICAPAFLPLFGKHKWREQMRALWVRSLPWMPWWRRAIRRANAVLAVNRETASLLQRVRKDPVPVMLETAAPDSSCEPVPPVRSDGTIRVAWIGNLIPLKGPLLALMAMRIVSGRRKDVVLHMAGSGSEESNLRRFVAENQMAQQIEFVGQIPKARVDDWLRQADLLLFTSVRDTSGNVVLEAMSCGLPVVGIAHQGVREICVPESSVLVPPASAEETAERLANAILSLCSDQAKRHQLGLAGWKRSQTDLSWQQYGERMWSIYQQVCHTRSLGEK